MPKWMLYVIMVLGILLLLPPAIIARKRSTLSEKPRIHIIQDMDNQDRYKAQHASVLFADGRAMRPPVGGTVARGATIDDSHFSVGLVDGQWSTGFPDQITVNAALIDRGEERFNIFCLPCHGAAGYGDGMIHQRAMELLNSGTNGTVWVAPKSLHDADIVAQPNGQYFNTITHGARTMPAYGAQIPPADRWAIISYIRALQKSQNATTQDVPAAQRGSIPEVPLTEEQIRALEAELEAAAENAEEQADES